MVSLAGSIKVVATDNFTAKETVECTGSAIGLVENAAQLVVDATRITVQHGIVGNVSGLINQTSGKMTIRNSQVHIYNVSAENVYGALNYTNAVSDVLLSFVNIFIEGTNSSNALYGLGD